MLSIDNTLLLVIDVQGRLAQVMERRETLFANVTRMVKGAQVLGLPLLLGSLFDLGVNITGALLGIVVLRLVTARRVRSEPK